MIFDREQKVLFIGDSITDCGRRQAHAPYGNGYVALARAFLLSRYAALGLSVENRGIGGNTVRDLAARWQEDVIAERPDWLSIKIGINDVWRTISNRLQEAVPLDEYELTLRQLLEETTSRLPGVRLILVEPYIIAPPVDGDPQRASGLSLADVQRVYPDLRQRGVAEGPEMDACMVHFRALMDQYVATVGRLAEEQGAVLVRTQAAFDEAMQQQPPGYWAADRVHPGAPGHGVIARAWLRAVGYGDV